MQKWCQYYYRARYYDAAVGEFINEDTIGFAGGDANLNRYVGNSPTNYVDPSGNISIPFTGGGAAAGGASGGGAAGGGFWAGAAKAAGAVASLPWKAATAIGGAAVVAFDSIMPDRQITSGYAEAQAIAKAEAAKRAAAAAAAAAAASSSATPSSSSRPVQAPPINPTTVASPPLPPLGGFDLLPPPTVGDLTETFPNSSDWISDWLDRLNEGDSIFGKDWDFLETILDGPGINDSPGEVPFFTSDNEPFSHLSRGPIERSDLNIGDLMRAGNQPYGKDGLTEAGRAWDKHANGQRGDSPFPPLSGNNQHKNRVANQQLSEILNSPDASFSKLGRGGIEAKLPDGRAVRFNSDGSFSGFID